MISVSYCRLAKLVKKNMKDVLYYSNVGLLTAFVKLINFEIIITKETYFKICPTRPFFFLNEKGRRFL